MVRSTFHAHVCVSIICLPCIRLPSIRAKGCRRGFLGGWLGPLWEVGLKAVLGRVGPASLTSWRLLFCAGRGPGTKGACSVGPQTRL